jgi:hypothetical protein
MLRRTLCPKHQALVGCSCPEPKVTVTLAYRQILEVCRKVAEYGVDMEWALKRVLAEKGWGHLMVPEADDAKRRDK